MTLRKAIKLLSQKTPNLAKARKLWQQIQEWFGENAEDTSQTANDLSTQWQQLGLTPPVKVRIDDGAVTAVVVAERQDDVSPMLLSEWVSESNPEGHVPPDSRLGSMFGAPPIVWNWETGEKLFVVRKPLGDKPWQAGERRAWYQAVYSTPTGETREKAWKECQAHMLVTADFLEEQGFTHPASVLRWLAESVTHFNDI